VYIMLES